jgi:hypothetical protein
MGLAKIIGNYDNPNSIGSRLRRRRSAPLRQMIEHVHAERGGVSLLDVGGREVYWTGIFPLDFLRQNQVKIHLINRAQEVTPPTQPDIFTATLGDGCALAFEDNAFDICHSNSVIEHVGNWGRRTAYAREVTRVARYYFHQTPNYWFPWEPHFGVPFFHWLPEPIRLSITMRRSLGWSDRAATVAAGMDMLESAVLLNKRMMAALFPDATIISERLAGLTKSFIAIRSPVPQARLPQSPQRGASRR